MNVTDACKDFLLKCFVKDPDKRPTCEKLLKHEWILSREKTEEKKVNVENNVY